MAAAAAAAAAARVDSLWRRRRRWCVARSLTNLQPAGVARALTAAATATVEEGRYCKTLSFISRECGEGLTTL